MNQTSVKNTDFKWEPLVFKGFIKDLSFKKGG